MERIYKIVGKQDFWIEPSGTGSLNLGVVDNRHPKTVQNRIKAAQIVLKTWGYKTRRIEGGRILNIA